MTTSPETQASEPEVAAARTVEPAGTTELSIDFGRIDSQGNVWVQDGDTERMIGSFRALHASLRGPRSDD